MKNWFQKVFVLNIDHRKDRWEHATNELLKCDLYAERFAGYDDLIYEGRLNGNAGCTASHRALLEIIAYHKWERVLVLEDDFLSLHEDINERFNSMICDLPDDWDLLYLGGHYAEPPIYRVSPHIIRCGRMMTTSSYAINWRHARRMAPHITGIGPIDSLFSGFAAQHNHYIFQPRLFAQYTSYSDLCNETRENTTCMTDTSHENMV